MSGQTGDEGQRRGTDMDGKERRWARRDRAGQLLQIRKGDAVAATQQTDIGPFGTTRDSVHWAAVWMMLLPVNANIITQGYFFILAHTTHVGACCHSARVEDRVHLHLA